MGGTCSTPEECAGQGYLRLTHSRRECLERILPVFRESGSQNVVDFALRFVNSPPTHWQEVPLPSLPPEDPLLAQVPQRLATLIAEAADFVPLARDAQAFGDWPSEDELIAHFVVPFLRTLGMAARADSRPVAAYRRGCVSATSAHPRELPPCDRSQATRRWGRRRTRAGT